MIVPGSASPLLTTTDGAYTISKSLRLRSSASAYLNRTPGSAGNQQKWTLSFWTKRASISGALQKIFEAGTNSSNYLNITWNGSGGGSGADQLDMYCSTAGSQTCYFDTAAVHRDCSAWYHVVIAADTTQATAANRMKFYVNGTQITAFTTANYPAQNSNLFINAANAHAIGNGISNGNYLDGYLSEFYLIDGTQKAASDFGENDTLTGVWKPKAYSGTYGTNGFYLKFTDVATTSGSNAGLGKDFSGNGNYWTTNNISVTSGATYDSMKDVPTLTDTDTANYCVWNPLSGNTFTISDGNLNATMPATSSTNGHAKGTIGVSSGKWYWEYTTANNGSGPLLGVVDISASNGSYIVSLASAWLYYGNNGNKYNGGTGSSYGATWTGATNIAVALDMDAGSITFYKNGTSQGTAFTGLTGTLTPAVSTDQSNDDWSVYLNCGQRPFAYTPPTGYKALNTYNLPDSTIVAGNKYMDATTYTGDGSSSKSVTNAGSFKPDLVWIKDRSSGTYWNGLWDSVRGNTSFLSSNDTGYYTFTDRLLSFNSNGFSVGSDAGVNTNNDSFIAWQWQAGQGTTSSNTNGTITSTVSVNPTAGFSVVTYTGNGTAGATFGHGLGVAPSMIIIKGRNASGDWQVYHKSIGNTAAIFLNLALGTYTTSLAWNNTSPTSSVVTLGSGGDLNGNTKTYVAYCWSEVPGFSKFGSYVGNEVADGPFIYTGFRPKFILFKNVTSTDRWWDLLDASRDSYNVASKRLFPNDPAIETTSTTPCDFLSNGFKIRTADASENRSGNTIVYAAFAENPFKNALAR